MSGYNAVTKGSSYNVQTGYYGHLTNNQLKNIALPDKLRCKRCQKWKQTDGKENFSKKQLAAVRETIYYSGRGRQTAVDVICSTCNSTQNTELHCIVCNTDKGLEGFAFAQRRDADRAMCFDCMNEHLEFDPDQALDELNNLRRPAVEVRDTDDDSSSDDSDDEMRRQYFSDEDTTIIPDSSTYDDDTSVSAYEGSDLSGSRQISASMDTLNLSTDASTSSGGIRLSQRDSQLSTWQTAPSGRARKAAPASTAASGSFTTSSSNAQCNRTGFAKIKACKPSAESCTPKSEQAKKAATSKLPIDLDTSSKCTNSDWDSEEEEHGSIATTRATRATQSELDNLEEHEITWDSDSSDDDDDYESDDE